MVALNAEKEYAEEAKERQRQNAQELNGRLGRGETNSQMFDYSSNKDESTRAEPARSTSSPTTHTTTSTSASHAKAQTKKKDSNEGKAAQQAAEAAGTNRDYVAKVKFLQSYDPELVKRIEAGTLTVPQAMKQVKAEQKAAERAAEVAAMQLEVKGNYAPDIIHGDALESSQPDP